MSRLLQNDAKRFPTISEDFPRLKNESSLKNKKVIQKNVMKFLTTEKNGR